jgi:hypothetical protein
LSQARKKVSTLQQKLQALTDPALHGRAALGVREAGKVGDTEIRIRGEAEKLGPVAARGFLTVLDVPDAPKVNAQQSGRLELAEWLTRPLNPLTPRVMVNRVWHHLFGRGLVSSVDNFGVTGDRPSHPELLDHLAARFMRDGASAPLGMNWSVKTLIRRIVLSRTYQLSSVDGDARSTDPDNRLLWRHSPRRLDAEELRDAMLAAAGRLIPTRPKSSPVKDLKVMEMPNNGAEALRLEKEGRASLHRSLYLPLLRSLVPQVLEIFDFANQGFVTGRREATTVATQALYLLNDSFVRDQSRALADRLLRRTDLDDAGRIHSAYRLTLAREATTTEIGRVEAYLSECEDLLLGSKNPKEAAWAGFCQALLGSAEFRYVR